jgi:hypothetical protein
VDVCANSQQLTDDLVEGLARDEDRRDGSDNLDEVGDANSLQR